MIKDKAKIKNKLEKELGRVAFPNEIINAEKDLGIIVPLLVEQIEDLVKRVELLEKKP